MASTIDPGAGVQRRASLQVSPRTRLSLHRALRSRWGWPLGAWLIALCVAAPVVALIWEAAGGSLEHWRHLAAHVLPEAAANTLWLLLGVGVLVACLGSGAAWLVTAYDFPTRKTLNWALLLPLAVPTYIVAFAYLDLLHPIGPFQSLVRDILGYSSPREFRLPDLRGLGGAIFLLGFVLYPYVYLSMRVMFSTQAASLLEAGRILGLNSRGVFFRVALPMARPALAVGVSLALLETMNDIGASEFLGVQTLTVSVYTTWVTRSDLAGAAQIALSMLALVVLLILLERHGRRRQRYASTQRMRPIQAQRLCGARAVLAFILGWLPVLIGFFAPAAYLINETIKRLHEVGGVSDQLLSSAYNTIRVSLIATLVTVLCGLILTWAVRSARARQPRVLSFLSRLSTIGYALPGTVLAIGLLLPVRYLDDGLNAVRGWFSGAPPSLLVMGTLTALLAAYVIRYLAIAVGSLESGLARIPPSLEQASRLLGESPSGTLRRVHLPLLKPALGAAALLIFVDTMKELPATLLLRPVNFETLATWLYAEAARGTYEEGAVAALAIVLVGLLPVILLARHQLKSGH